MGNVCVNVKFLIFPRRDAPRASILRTMYVYAQKKAGQTS